MHAPNRSRYISRLRVVVAIALVAAWLAGQPLWAGGPRWVAGSSYFNSSVKGRPVVWKDGIVRYYTDQGNLSAGVNNVSANTLVLNAIYPWNSVATSSVVISAAGTLAEDVSGVNILQGPGVAYPADVQSMDKPVAVIYDVDGSITEVVDGPGAGAESSCPQWAVTPIVDGMSAEGFIRHAILILNGRCVAGTGAVLATQKLQMQYQLERAFGQVLGLDWSQTNDNAFTTVPAPTLNDYVGWPLMHPIDIDCGTGYSYQCSPVAFNLRMDERATLRRLYPVTAANLGSLPGKQLTAPNSVRIYGRVRFRNGQGMQGVNVVARQLGPHSQLPDSRYTASAVTGVLFRGSSGNPVTGSMDAHGIVASRFGGDDLDLEGFYDLGGLDLGYYNTIANYQITLEPVNPLYRDGRSVGPYKAGTPLPSGTMPVVTIYELKAGTDIEQDFDIPDAAGDGHSGADGDESAPAAVAGGGVWTGRISGYGHTAWLGLRTRANRTLTIETTALDDQMLPTYRKAMPVIGAWSGVEDLGTLPDVATAQPFNGTGVGQTQLNLATTETGQTRLAVADLRGDGRPDFVYHGRLLYADTIEPARLGLDGGRITIRGMGFPGNSRVTVGGVAVTPLSLTPNRIVLDAPVAGTGGDGTVDIQIADPITRAETTMRGALTYGVVPGDRVLLVDAPSGLLTVGVPAMDGLAVRAVAADGLTPLAGVAVTFTAASGAATLGACGAPVCTVLTGQDGIAQAGVTPLMSGALTVVAGLGNGASIQIEATVSGTPSGTGPGTEPGVGGALVPLVGQFEVAARRVVEAMAGVVDLAAGVPLVNQTVSWTADNSQLQGAAVSTTDAQGVATIRLETAPLAVGGHAVVTGCTAAQVCTKVTAIGADPAKLEAVSGAEQVIRSGEIPDSVVMRVSSTDGRPLLGAEVRVYEMLHGWVDGCGPGIARPAVTVGSAARRGRVAGWRAHRTVGVRGGRCTARPLARSLTAVKVSDADGLFSFEPFDLGGLSGHLTLIAVAAPGVVLRTAIDIEP